MGNFFVITLFHRLSRCCVLVSFFRTQRRVPTLVELSRIRLLPASACQKSRACLRPCAEMRWNPTDLEENDFCFSYALNHQVLRLPRPIGCAGISPLRPSSRTSRRVITRNSAIPYALTKDAPSHPELN